MGVFCVPNVEFMAEISNAFKLLDKSKGDQTIVSGSRVFTFASTPHIGKLSGSYETHMLTGIAPVDEVIYPPVIATDEQIVGDMRPDASGNLAPNHFDKSEDPGKV